MIWILVHRATNVKVLGQADIPTRESIPNLSSVLLTSLPDGHDGEGVGTGILDRLGVLPEKRRYAPSHSLPRNRHPLGCVSTYPPSIQTTFTCTFTRYPITGPEIRVSHLEGPRAQGVQLVCGGGPGLYYQRAPLLMRRPYPPLSRG
jgi:hypothetical protein